MRVRFAAGRRFSACAARGGNLVDGRRGFHAQRAEMAAEILFWKISMGFLFSDC